MVCSFVERVRGFSRCVTTFIKRVVMRYGASIGCAVVALLRRASLDACSVRYDIS